MIETNNNQINTTQTNDSEISQVPALSRPKFQSFKDLVVIVVSLTVFEIYICINIKITMISKLLALASKERDPEKWNWLSRLPFIFTVLMTSIMISILVNFVLEVLIVSKILNENIFAIALYYNYIASVAFVCNYAICTRHSVYVLRINRVWSHYNN